MLPQKSPAGIEYKVLIDRRKVVGPRSGCPSELLLSNVDYGLLLYHSGCRSLIQPRKNTGERGCFWAIYRILKHRLMERLKLRYILPRASYVAAAQHHDWPLGQ
jgi:hypothetical protein